MCGPILPNPLWCAGEIGDGRPNGSGGRMMTETTCQAGNLYPVILSGGAGTRLWPLSRQAFPKQLLALDSERSMLQETALRVDGGGFAKPTVVCNDEHRFVVAEQLREIGIRPRAILLEPVGRNTAPAVAAAAISLIRDDPGAIMLVLPSDHVVRDVTAFRAAAATAAAAAAGGALVTFGIPAEGPETGYGYIRRGAPLEGVEGCFHVARFVEKPDRATAESYLAEGGYDWNSGMFVFRAANYLAELERLKPAVMAGCRAALEAGQADLDFLRLNSAAFAACESISIDYAVMEQARSAAVVPVAMGWNDIGSWSALWDVGEKNGEKNVCYGDILIENVKNSYVRTSGPLTAVLGLEGVVVVVTDDVVLVASRDQAQDVKGLVERLEAKGRTEHLVHLTQYRPWGRHQVIDSGERFEVRRITVLPGGSFSLQRHRRRAEHWIVVSGVAKVTRGGDVFTVRENESTYIPVGAVHRLENPGPELLQMIEVQSGVYLGEDDVERLDDAYGRV
jgi:mannose-1-phosphate guanylyltransferase/mannose-1-phosphate guanylyltransferase/mannose-6-phosphate isomerase